MTITVLVFSLVAALVIGVLGALLFSAFCVGIALLVLLPVLFITTFAGAFIWLWGVGGYYILKWFNKKDIPGIHTSMEDGLKGEDGPLGGLSALNGEAKGSSPREQKRLDAPAEKKSAERQTNGTAKKSSGGDGGKTTGADVGDLKKAADVGKTAGKAANVGDLGGVKGSVPGGVL